MQLLRLSGILQSLHDAFEFVCTNDDEKFELNERFDENLTKYLEDLPTDGVVSIENVNRAHFLLDYFNKTKLILSGYDSPDWTESVFNILSNLIADLPEDNKSHVRTIEQEVANKIFCKAELCVELNNINQNIGKKVNIKIICKVAENLESQNLGRVKQKINTKGPPTKYFEKNIITSFTHEIIAALESNDIDLQMFKAINTELQCK
jgi:hypothetical protein